MQLVGYLRDKAPHTPRVLTGRVVADLGHPAKQFESLQLGLAQLERPGLYKFLQDVSGFFEPEVREASVEERVNMEDELYRIEWLSEEILRPGPVGQLPSFRVH